MSKYEILAYPQGPVVSQYIKETHRRSMIMGPLGSAKTFGSCEKIIRLMCAQAPNRQGIRKTRFYAIRNTYPDLQTTTIKDWLDLFGDLGTYKGGGQSPPCHSLRFAYTCPHTGQKSIVQSEVVFIAMDRPTAVKKLRGAQLTWAWLNEVKELSKEIVDMVDLRVGRYPSKIDGGPTHHGIFGDTNAPDDDSWYYDLAEVKKPEGWKFFRQKGGVEKEYKTDDRGHKIWTGKWIANPQAENLSNLPHNYYITGMEGKTDDWIGVNLANLYGDTHDGKPIYAQQWNDLIHVSDTAEVIPGLPIIVGFDYGLTPAAIIGQETPSGKINILDELIGDGQGIKQFWLEVVEPFLRIKYKDCEWNFVGDPAGRKRSETDEKTVFGVLDSLGCYAEAADSNDPEVRWESVRSLLQQLRSGEPAFQLNPRCKVLRKGFNSGYHFKRVQVSGQLVFSIKANKNKYSHPHDALQYLCMWLTGNSVPVVPFKRGPDENYV